MKKLFMGLIILYGTRALSHVQPKSVMDYCICEAEQRGPAGEFRIWGFKDDIDKKVKIIESTVYRKPTIEELIKTCQETAMEELIIAGICPERINN